MTGSDTSHTTGKICSVGKKSDLKVLMKAPSHVIPALADLGKDEKPPTNVISGCEEFCCMLVGTNNISARDHATLRWKKFRKLSENQSADMLPPTSGAWLQHISRAHVQAFLWSQDDVLNPTMPDPCQLGRSKDDGRAGSCLS